jgi:putative PIN family toxin of toxin-antitoxin system
MRVMADTNIFISALLFPASVPAKVLLHIAKRHELVLCDHIIAEIRDVVSRKRPDLSGAVDVLLARLSYELAVAPHEPGPRIGDPKDQPILNAALMARVEVIVSGDKHFLELDLDRPKTMSPAEFWRLEG